MTNTLNTAQKQSLEGRLKNFERAVKLYYTAISERKASKTEETRDNLRRRHEDVMSHNGAVLKLGKKLGIDKYNLNKMLDEAEERGRIEARS